MILIDTSAWIQFLRGTADPVADRVEQALAEPIATCDPVVMELLAGARDERHLAELRGLSARATLLPTTPAHYEQAAALYRTARASGHAVRRMIDCLIAAIAIDSETPLLHCDRDFTSLAACSRLQLAE